MVDIRAVNDTPTSKLRALDVGADVPVGRRLREDSTTLTRSLIDDADSVLRKHAGAGLSEETRRLITERVQQHIDSFLREDTRRNSAASSTVAPFVGHMDDSDHRPRRGRTRALAGWFVAGFFACVTLIGALVITWQRINQLEARQTADDEYAMTVANWLIIANNNNCENAKNQDAMNRIIARATSADVSQVPAPNCPQPPTAVQRKQADYRLSIGDK